MSAAASLHIDIEVGARPAMRRLVERARQLLAADPSLLRELHDGTLELRCPVPPTYKPSLYRGATELRGRLSRSGWLFDISECFNGSSGGYLASTIPASWYEGFLKAWCAYASQPRQGELFAELAR